MEKKKEQKNPAERRKIAKPRKILNDWQAPYIQSLKKLIESQSKETLVNWAVNYSEKNLLPLWEKEFPGDLRPQSALQVARKWLAGEIKLPQARTVILGCHSAAREAEGRPIPQAVARAIGQSASTIHSPRHSIGLAFYGALAVAYDIIGVDKPWEVVLESAASECARMESALRDTAVINEPNPAKINWRR